jgi:VIT1/CCC1 family predicted Fe2+/Mn2+ transporter
MGPRMRERHHVGRVGWLRAAVLGANGGILSTSSLLLGVAVAHATHGGVLIAGSFSRTDWGVVTKAAAVLDRSDSPLRREIDRQMLFYRNPP